MELRSGPLEPYHRYLRFRESLCAYGWAYYAGISRYQEHCAVYLRIIYAKQDVQIPKFIDTLFHT